MVTPGRKTETFGANRHPQGEQPVEVTATQARQGFLGRPVLAVLVVGIILALAAWAVAEYLVYPVPEAGQQSVSPSDATEPGVTTTPSDDAVTTPSQEGAQPAQ